jgi:hypothetical protein
MSDYILQMVGAAFLAVLLDRFVTIIFSSHRVDPTGNTEND